MSRTVVVTGGAGGIGRATVWAYTEAGERVVALGRDPEALAKLSEPEAETMVCDVTDETAVRETFAQIGAVDVLVNNAGIGESAPLARTTLESWTRHLEVNATGPFLCLRSSWPPRPRPRSTGRRG